MAQRNGRAAVLRASRLASDERLVALVRRGDGAAFEALYDRHARELLSFCACILGSREDAEDAVQATFVSAYTALRADDRPVDVRPWLFAIARNASLTILRKRRPAVTILERASREELVAQVERRENMRQLLDAVLALPERQRTALVLAELHGHSHSEIGAVLGVSAQKVKAYVYQARTSLLSELSARSADCEEIREELTVARGAALLRGRLRRHLRTCAHCREFAREASARRRQLGALLPLAPSLALKRRVLHATVGKGGGAHAGAAAAGGGGSAAGGSSAIGGSSFAGTTAELGGLGVKALVVKALVTVAVAGVGTTAGALTLGVASPGPAGYGRASTAAGMRLAADVTAVRGGSAGLERAGGVSSPTQLGGATGNAVGAAVAVVRGQSADAHSPRAHGAVAGQAGGANATAHGSSASRGDGANHANGGANGNSEGHGGNAGAHGNSAGHGNAGAHGKSAGHGNAGAHGKSAGSGHAGARGKGAARGNTAGHGDATSHGSGQSGAASHAGGSAGRGGGVANGHANGQAGGSTQSNAANASPPGNANAGGNAGGGVGLADGGAGGNGHAEAPAQGHGQDGGGDGREVAESPSAGSAHGAPGNGATGGDHPAESPGGGRSGH